MRLRAERVRQLAEQAGLSRDELAAGIERSGLTGVDARRALENWLRGSDHPRCRAIDLSNLARSLGVEVSAIARFQSAVYGNRGSPRKARLLTDLIRGKRVDEALNLLQFSPKRAAVSVRKALTAALAEAEQAEADLERLVVAESRVDEGPTIKRFRPKDRGRAHPIMKRTAHITVGLEERA